MSLFHLATDVLWLLPLALQYAIAIVMYFRGLARRFPFFFTYSLLLPARDLILLRLPYPGPVYSRVYWWGEAGAILLSFGIIVEIIWHLTKPYPFLRTVFKVLWIVAILATLASLAVLLWSNGPSGEDLILERVILMQRSARFLQVCVLIVVIGLMSRLGLTWHHDSLGIAIGFGVYAALDLAFLEFRANLHAVTNTAFVLLRSSAYNLAVVIWSFYFLRRREVNSVESLPSTDLASWNETLTQHLDKWYQRS
jgi:hypothetical protein